MKLTNAEKETIICFDEESPSAGIYTFNNQLKKRLAVLREKHPDVFRLIREDSALGSAEYSVPVELLTVKFREPLSEKQREAFRQAGKKRLSGV